MGRWESRPINFKINLLLHLALHNLTKIFRLIVISKRLHRRYERYGLMQHVICSYPFLVPFSLEWCGAESKLRQVIHYQNSCSAVCSHFVRVVPCKRVFHKKLAKIMFLVKRQTRPKSDQNKLWFYKFLYFLTFNFY